ncbi:hypothetical protein BCU68_04330 [Vibrio sp. 10N.286.49.B3]|uniref:methyl-accepting chemotaxis protein n=1 Tax=Vibrio sp. 10N.286.49.B3 TaxID=1880855 RepID=UPI000C834CA8|nr:methyl-accepting chemotaxis protein [Vibrio sp. 10N.286.49.B3]PMH43221.1 hypothetical protein BCU68_04330 [Vibrio sp. 10N.286.49.B3]
MSLTSLVSRVYLGFSLLILTIISASWFSIYTNQEINARINIITQQSTPLMIKSAELNIALLNINRSLTPYFSAIYVDELDAYQSDINAAISVYQQQLDWFVSANYQAERNGLVSNTSASSNKIVTKIEELYSQNYQYLDTKDFSQYSQSQFQLLAGQLNENLITALSRSSTTAEQQVIEAVLAQMSLLLAEANEAFALQDMMELRSITRRFESRRERLDAAITTFKLQVPTTYSRVENLMTRLLNEIYEDNGAVALHLNTQEQAETLVLSRAEFETYIDQTLLTIDALADNAVAMSEQLALESTQQAEHARIGVITIALLSVLFATLVGMHIARMIRTPSQLLENALEKVANKDLSSCVNYKINNEFGRVAKKVNLVIDHLSYMLKELIQSSTALNKASLDNQSISEALSSDIDQQTAQTIQVAAAMEQIELSITEIATSTNETLSIVTQAVESSNSGQVSMNDNIELVEQLSEKLSFSTKTIHQLEQESSSIESILDVIAGISDQTNLLALNAAIEAARAGEQGRGFSVVADEVRVLAAKTNASTQEIQHKINQLQHSSNLAVVQVNECVNFMKDCIVQSGHVNDSLASVHDLLGQVESRTHQIASATTEQQSVSQEVTANISGLHTLAVRNTERAKELASHSQSLEVMAEHQAKLSGQFQLVKA